MTRKTYIALTLVAGLASALPGFAEPTAPPATTGAECTSVTERLSTVSLAVRPAGALRR
jgi:hypothetical protein